MKVTKVVATGIEFDSEAQKNLAVPLGQREFFPNAAMRIADGLVENHVTAAFGSPGGHIWNLVDTMSRRGIRMHIFGHEQNATYAAEAYAQVSGKAGTIFATAGPGMLNTVPGVNQAWLSQTPMILLFGAHDPDVDGQYLSLQEGYATKVMGSMAKTSDRIFNSSAAKQHFIRGFQVAQSAPRGPVVFELPISMLRTRLDDEARLFHGTKGRDQKYVSEWAGEQTGRPFSAGAGEPEYIAKAIQQMQEAKAPAWVIGDGARWCDAGPELEELARLLKIPFGTRRLARGLISDNHPNAVRGKIPYDEAADLIVLWGAKVNSFDNYGAGWPPAVQIVEAQTMVQTFMPTRAAVVGNIKSVARAMIEYVKANGIQPPEGRDAWVAKAKQNTINAAERRRKKAMHYGFEHPRYKKFNICHYGYLSQAMADYLEEHYQSRARVMVDGFTISDYAPPFLKATRPAQILSASEQGGVGHGIGMAIGAAVAQREEGDETPILSLMGDSGMGNAGPDVEVAVRYKLPIVFVVTNNDGWMPGQKYLYYGKNYEALGGQGQERVKNDWAAVGKGLGCHAERVDRHEEFLPALHRAFQAAESGMPAVLDCIMDKRLENRVVTTNYTVGYSHIPYHELPPEGKAWRKKNASRLWPALKDEETIPLNDPWEPIGNLDELE